MGTIMDWKKFIFYHSTFIEHDTCIILWNVLGFEYHAPEPQGLMAQITDLAQQISAAITATKSHEKTNEDTALYQVVDEYQIAMSGEVNAKSLAKNDKLENVEEPKEMIRVTDKEIDECLTAILENEERKETALDIEMTSVPSSAEEIEPQVFSPP